MSDSLKRGAEFLAMRGAARAVKKDVRHGELLRCIGQRHECCPKEHSPLK